MTRTSGAWLLIAFLIALLGVGFRYWQVPYEQANLPDSLYGPGLAAVFVVALMLRAFGVAKFSVAWLLIAAAVPVAVVLRVLAEVSVDASSHNLWPLELAIGTGLGLLTALGGALLGSLFLLRSSRRP